MGLNTIETYVAWNAHEPRRGEWDATGWNDLGRFLDLIAEEGMHAIVRPGPLHLRRVAQRRAAGVAHRHRRDRTAPVRAAVPRGGARRTCERVYEIVEPRQIDRGGPVILVQIENEYGAYGDDKDYLRELVRVTRDAGITVPLTTIDQPTAADAERREPRRAARHGLVRLAGRRSGSPRCASISPPDRSCAPSSGTAGSTGGAATTTRRARRTPRPNSTSLLAAGASVNFYMFHGGTNFGLTNGANDKGRYLPIVTSYDYDAPLDEAGNPTDKYFAFRDVIARYADGARRGAGRPRRCRAGVRRSISAPSAAAGGQHRRGSTCTGPRRRSRSSGT